MATIARSIRLEPELWEALDALARADQRTTASLIRKVLHDHALPSPTRPHA